MQFCIVMKPNKAIKAIKKYQKQKSTFWIHVHLYMKEIDDQLIMIKLQDYCNMINDKWFLLYQQMKMLQGMKYYNNTSNSSH